MNVLAQVLDGREDDRHAVQLDAAKAAEVWQLRGNTPESRLLAFDRWLRLQLETRLDWTWAGAQRARRIEQCRIVLEQLVLDLWRRGWMLDGKVLARRITDLLDAVASYQRKGGVADFWAYFRSSVSRYVGANAEEIQAESRRLGTHVGNVIAALGLQPQEGPALPELAAQRASEVADAKQLTLREKLARERARKAANAAQGELL